MLPRFRAFSVVCAVLMTFSLLPAQAHAKPDAKEPHGDPWPSGNEWPPGLEGPFAVKSIERIEILSFDGTQLRGWLWLPDLPDGVLAPTVLWSSPYFGNLDGTGNDANEGGLLDGDPTAHSGVHKPVPVARLLREGYAVAAISMRGTGDSDGCYDQFSVPEQRDQAVLVDWLASQPWSNGRIGMMGLSADANTAIEAAVQAPPTLKAIIAMSGGFDYWLGLGTPEGTLSASTVVPNYPVNEAVTVGPPVDRTGDVAAESQSLLYWGGSAVSQRMCLDSVASQLLISSESLAEDRDASFWESHRFTDGLPNVTAASLITFSFGDSTMQNYAVDAVGWQLLEHAPKQMMLGQWGHSVPLLDTWTDTAMGWFDFWLKGVGDPPNGLGTVDYETHDDLWHTSDAWPPRETREETLYLDTGKLGQEADGSAASYLSSAVTSGDSAVCSTSGVSSLVYEGDVLTEPATIAGSPFAYLRLTSTDVGGQVDVHLFDVGPNASCATGSPADFTMLSQGSADLRYYDGGYDADDFPIGTPVNVRIDLSNIAETIPAGHHLAVVISGDDLVGWSGQTFFPTITVDAKGGRDSSQIVIPVIGTVGGVKPKAHFPARPDLPTSAHPEKEDGQ